MSTTATHTALETLFLFRGIASHGLDDEAFATIAHRLQSNDIIRGDNTYNADRLKPEILRDLFLDIVWEQLKIENDAAARPDGGSSPSKKRKLQQPHRPTLAEAPFIIDQIENAYNRLQDAYFRDTVAQIRRLEAAWDSVQQNIVELEEAEVAEAERAEAAKEAERPVARINNAERSTTPVVPKEIPAQLPPRVANGVAPSPGVSPKPAPRSPPALPSQPVARPIVARAAPSPTLPVQAPTGTPSPAPAPAPAPVSVPPVPVATHPQHVPPPRLGQQPLPKVPGSRIQETPVTPRPSTSSPGLQLPQGLPPFQPTPFAPPRPSPVPQATTDGLQRPEEVARPKQLPTVPAVNPHATPQGQLKWEPPYQPNVPIPRPTHAPAQQQTGQGFIQPPQVASQQRVPQQLPQQLPPQSGPRPLQPQPAKPAAQPVLIPPQTTGQYPAPLQQAPTRPTPDAVGPSQNRQPLIAPNAQPNRAPQPVYHHGYAQPPQARQAAPSPAQAPAPATVPTTSPTQLRPHPGLAQTVPSRPPAQQPLQAPPPYSQQGGALPAPPSPAIPQTDSGRIYSSPYPAPRPAIPDRIHSQQRLPGTPSPASLSRITTASFAPQTPVAALPPRLLTGSSTKWGLTSTPSTPTHGLEFRFTDEAHESPAYEKLSPVLQPAALPIAASSLKAPVAVPEAEQKKPSPALAPAPNPAADKSPGTPPKRKAGRPRNAQRAQDNISPPKPAPASLAIPPAPVPSGSGSRNTPTPAPRVEETPQVANEPDLPQIKDEVMTPRPLTEAGDTTADESVAGRRHPRHAKRKREDTSPTPIQTPVGNQQSFFETTPAARPIEPPTEVLWTRAFNKVSASAMEQIIHHRFASMFATAIRERDAPGYNKVILQPQDLKRIKSAISAGNRAAVQAAAALPGGDPNTSSVWLPVNENLLPPNAIINSGQLDREFAHMFSNAIMYNPDPGHGPGPAFLVRDEGSQGDDQEGGGAHGHDTLGYKVDEFGVVNDARAMYWEVEKLLSELRSAEVRRTGGEKTGATTGTSTRQASVAQREASQAGDDGPSHNFNGGDDGDEHTATEAETGAGNTAKRRRTTRG